MKLDEVGSSPSLSCVSLQETPIRLSNLLMWEIPNSVLFQSESVDLWRSTDILSAVCKLSENKPDF